MDGHCMNFLYQQTELTHRKLDTGLAK